MGSGGDMTGFEEDWADAVSSEKCQRASQTGSITGGVVTKVPGQVHA